MQNERQKLHMKYQSRLLDFVIIHGKQQKMEPDAGKELQIRDRTNNATRRQAVPCVKKTLGNVFL